MFNYKMSVKTINIISYIFAIISIFLIVLGCIAPIYSHNVKVSLILRKQDKLAIQ